MTMTEVRKRIKLSAVVGLLSTVSVVSLSPLPLTSRRAWLAQSAGSFLVAGHNSDTKDELPNVLRGISLAPLGKPQASDSKTLNLSLEEVAARLTRDLTEGARTKTEDTSLQGIYQQIFFGTTVSFRIPQMK